MSGSPPISEVEVILKVSKALKRDKHVTPRADKTALRSGWNPER